jgi:hypothetical protein
MAHRELSPPPTCRIQIRFEPARTAPASMVKAYEQIVPLRQPIRQQSPPPLLHSPLPKGEEQ